MNFILLVPPKITVTSGTNKTIREGNKLSLQCKSSGEPTALISWQSTTNKSLTFNKSSGLLTIQSIDKTDSGNYSCSASNLAGSDSYTISILVECEYFFFYCSYTFS